MDYQCSRALLEQAASLVDQASDGLEGTSSQAHVWLTLARRGLLDTRANLDEALKELRRQQGSAAPEGGEQQPAGEVVGPDDPDLGWHRVPERSGGTKVAGWYIRALLTPGKAVTYPAGGRRGPGAGHLGRGTSAGDGRRPRAAGPRGRRRPANLGQGDGARGGGVRRGAAAAGPIPRRRGPRRSEAGPDGRA
jgi:hypothetical protein